MKIVQLDYELVKWILLTGLAVLFLFHPQLVIKYSPQCLISSLIGDGYCWGCGLTRAFAYLVRGQLKSAFQMNPLIAIVLPLILWQYLKWTFSLYKEKTQA